jgi:F-type H+-transporting ATPase subunit c
MRKSAYVLLAAMFAPALAFAQAADHVAAATSAIGDRGLFGLGVGLMLGLGALGGTMGQGRVGASAMEGLARNPQARPAMFVPMILVLVFIESLFILTWALGFLLNNKI